MSAITATNVPINLLNPRPGTKFGDRERMDPWEVVKWIAIFRLILSEALFRLCGGRVENLGELQATAGPCGPRRCGGGQLPDNAGRHPEQDQQMFPDAGLNIARQDDNGSNPRPDSRSGWLDGATPDAVGEYLGTIEDAGRGHHGQNLGSGDATALRQTGPGTTENRRGTEPVARRPFLIVDDVAVRLEELRALGLYRRLRQISGPLDGEPVLLLCSNSCVGLADHTGVRDAAADAAMRRGAGAGASRLVSGV